MTISDNIYTAVFDNAVQAIVLIDEHGVIRDVNPATMGMFGYPREQLLGQNVAILMPSPDAEQHDGYLHNYLKTGEARIIGVGRETVARHCDGQEFPVELAVSEVKADSGRFFVGMISDISERKESEYLLSMNTKVMRAINGALGGFINANIAKREVFESLLEKLLDITGSEYGFIGEILHGEKDTPYLKTFAITNIAWNYETRKFYRDNVRKGLEFHNMDTLFGITIRTGEIVVSNDPTGDPRSGGLPMGHPPLDAYLGVPLYSGNKLIGMAGVANRSGGYDDELADLIKPLLGTMGSLIAGYQNLHSRRQAEQELYRAQAKLRQVAKEDALTGISNRKSLFDQLADAFLRSREADEDFSVLFIDIDYFKRINDELGHMAGDEALKRAVAVIQDHMRPSDIFGRYGGEEFVVGLLNNGTDTASDLAERLRVAMEQADVRVAPDADPVKLSISIGVAAIAEDTADIDALVNQADQAMLLAKRAGRNCVRVYEKPQD